MSMQYWGPRLILRGTSTESDVQQFAGLMRLTHSEMHKISEESEENVSRTVAWQIKQGLNMYYVEESVSGCNFLQVFGDTSAGVDAITVVLIAVFQPWTWIEVLGAVEAAQGTENKAAAIVRAGVASPGLFDQQFYDCFSLAIRDDNSRIREAGIWACAYSHWAEFKPLLEGVESSDPIEQLRTDAKIILDVSYREVEP